MRPKTALCFSLIPLALVTAQLSLSQAQVVPEESDPPAIRQAFEKAKISLPQLGWIIPSGELVTEVSAPTLTVLSDRSRTVTAHHPVAISAAQVQEFAKHQQVDCDQLDEPSPTPLFRYQTGLPPQKRVSQVLVTSASVPDETIQSGGLPAYTPSSSEQSAIWKALLSEPTGKHRSRSFAIPGSPVFYTLAATYNPKGVILRSGIFLEDHSARILGQEIQNIQGLEQCDGCAVLTEKDGIDTVYDVENLLRIPGLPYPALLIDSSTVEGRAIEIFTFASQGGPTRFRLYEYMVTCILGPPDAQAKPQAQ